LRIDQHIEAEELRRESAWRRGLGLMLEEAFGCDQAHEPGDESLDLLEHETAVATLRAQALQIGRETPDMAVILARRVLAHDERRIAAMKRGVGHVHRIVGERFGPR